MREVRPKSSGAMAGFTLVEAAITITILALAVGVVLANWGSASAELRRAAGQLSGTVRASYDEAALTGKTVRIVFAFDKPVVQVEGSEALLSFDDEQRPLQRGAGLAQKSGPVGPSLIGFALGGAMTGKSDGEEKGKKSEDDAPPSALQALLGLSKQIDKEEQAPAFSSLGHDLALGADVKLLDVWIQGMGDPIKEGIAYLYFHPNGYTQDAIIHLTNTDGAVFSIKVAGLSGQTEVVPEYIEAPK